MDRSPYSKSQGGSLFLKISALLPLKRTCLARMSLLQRPGCIVSPEQILGQDVLQDISGYPVVLRALVLPSYVLEILLENKSVAASSLSHAARERRRP